MNAMATSPLALDAPTVAVIAIVIILQMTRTNDPIPVAESVEFMSGMRELERTHRRFPSPLICN